LMYTKVFLRLEPLGLELVAQSLRRAGHQIRLIDLQVEDHRAYFRLLQSWRPEIVAFSCNYLANVPEIVDLAKATKARFPENFVCVGGHSASFTASAIIEHGAGAIDCVLKGEGEAAMPLLIAAIEAGNGIGSVPGAVSAAGEGPPPGFVHSLDELMPARDLLRHRRKYFLGTLDRIFARLSLGLLILQRLDFLWPQLSGGEPAAGGRGFAVDPRTGCLHCR
jgi:hopanoid C-3 methylase